MRFGLFVEIDLAFGNNRGAAADLDAFNIARAAHYLGKDPARAAHKVALLDDERVVRKDPVMGEVS